LWKVLLASPALYTAGALTFAGSFILLSTAIETLGAGPAARSASLFWLLPGPFIVLVYPGVLAAVGAAMLLTVAGVRLFSVKPEALA
jgi:hypothetical protein